VLEPALPLPEDQAQGDQRNGEAAQVAVPIATEALTEDGGRVGGSTGTTTGAPKPKRTP
jgi:hypothetical protein